MNEKLGIPYMGSKRAIAPEIVNFIKKENPKVKYFYDLFGGGGAISFYALNLFEYVIYNDYNKGVVSLLDKILTDGITDDFYHWVDMEEFNKLKTGTDWKSGWIKTCWSFGNNQKNYMYGKKFESNKKLLHDLIVGDLKEKLEKELNVKLRQAPQNLSVQKRRLWYKKQLAKCGFEHLRQLEHLQRLQHLERVQQLEQLQHLERRENLTIKNLSYQDVTINTPPDETVIYLDPPYKNTAKYEFGICHIEFEKFVQELKTQGYIVYVSGYHGEYPVVLELNKRQLLATTKTKIVIEKLFKP